MLYKLIQIFKLLIISLKSMMVINILDHFKETLNFTYIKSKEIKNKNKFIYN